MQYKDAALGDTVYFWFAVNAADGDADDGSAPLFDVRLAGAAAGAAPVLSGTPTLLTHANYSNGLYEIAVVATEGNGFAAGNEYAVFCNLAIGSPAVNPAGFVGSVRLRAAASDLGAAITRVLLALPAAAADAAGGLPVSDAGGLDLDNKVGLLAFTTDGANKYVKADSVFVAGAAPDDSADIAAAVRDVDNSTPAVSSIGAVLNAILAKLPGLSMSGAVDTPSPDTNSATTFLTDLISGTADYYKDALLLITSGALIGQVKKISADDGAGALTVIGGFTGTPADGVTFRIINQ